MERAITVLRRRAKELQGKLEGARKRFRRSERERERQCYPRDPEWLNDQLVSRDDELAGARKRLAAPQPGARGAP